MSENRRFERFQDDQGSALNQEADSLAATDVAIFGGERIERKSRLPENALIPLEDGSIRQGVFTLTTKGLILTGEASKDDWQRIGGLILNLDGAIQWLMGDYLAYNERIWGKTYEQFALEWGRDPKTLRNYVWVAGNVDLSLRKDKLTFGHHNLVAGMDADQQGYWLEWAVAKKASISQLAIAIRKAQEANADPPPEPIAPKETRRALKNLSSITEIVLDDPTIVDQITSDLDQTEALVSYLREFYPKQ